MNSTAQNPPLYIFIGEKHDDFNYITLASNVMQSCKQKDLSVEIYSEFGDQVKKVVMNSDEIRQQFPDRPPSAEELKQLKLKSLPNGWLETAKSVSVGGNHSVKKIRDIEFRRDVCSPRVEECKKLSIAEILKKYPVSEPHNIIFIQPWLNSYKGDVSIYNAKDTDSFLENCHQSITTPLVAQDIAKQIKSISNNADAIIVWTGFWHTENMIKELKPERMVVMSNCSKENDDFLKTGKYLNGVDITPFTQLKTPDTLEERLAEIKKSKGLQSSLPHHQMPTQNFFLEEKKDYEKLEYAGMKQSQKTFVEKLKESVKHMEKTNGNSK